MKICPKKYQEFVNYYTKEQGHELPVLYDNITSFTPLSSEDLLEKLDRSITIRISSISAYTFDRCNRVYQHIAERYGLWEDASEEDHECRFIDNGFSKEHYCYFDGCDKFEIGGLKK